MSASTGFKSRTVAPRDFLVALRAQEPSLRNLASTLCRSRDKADRLVARVMEKAELEHASYDRKANFAGWLMRMMRNEFNSTLSAASLVEEAAGPAASPSPLPPPQPTKPPVLFAPPSAPSAIPGSPSARILESVDKSTHRKIDIGPFRAALKKPKSEDLGPRPDLAWIDISLLRIDQRYQREILRRGRGNVIRIAAEFNWNMFATVIVARLPGGLYAIVDGQHRTTAAACRGILAVPCQIIDAQPSEQAAAFAAINGNVTQMSSLQLHAARVAAGDGDAARLDEVCAGVGAEILKYPVPSNLIKAGQTLAVSCLAVALKTYGPEVLSTALLCITGTGDGNTGLLRAPLIRGLCQVLAVRPRIAADRKAALAIAEKIDFAQLLEDASVDAKRGRTQVSHVVVAKLSTPFGSIDPAALASA